MGLIHRQPDVGFPRKIGSGPLGSLSVRQLRAALAGPHGYVKASPEESQATAAATLVCRETSDHDDDIRKSLSPSSPKVEVRQHFHLSA